MKIKLNVVSSRYYANDTCRCLYSDHLGTVLRNVQHEPPDFGQRHQTECKNEFGAFLLDINQRPSEVVESEKPLAVLWQNMNQ